jgi:uncharacterized protein YaaQ
MDSQTEARSVLLFAIVQDQDVEPAQKGLEKINLIPSVLPSIGGFLGRKNNTLLIGCTEAQLSEVTRILQENCHQRTEYMALPMETNQMSVTMASALSISVGGATVFSFEVEHEEIIQ